MENISLPGLLITAISGFSYRLQDRVASWDGHNGGSPWLKGLIMTNAAVTASSRVRGIFKRISQSLCSHAHTYTFSQLRLGWLKQISRVHSMYVRMYARNASSHDRCIRHGTQCIVCPSISINSICFRISAKTNSIIIPLDEWTVVMRWNCLFTSPIYTYRGPLRICSSLCWIYKFERESHVVKNALRNKYNILIFEWL